MYPKFIIVTLPKETKGILRMGMVVNHKDLVIGYEKVHGGGWWEKDDRKKEIILYGSSGDYGAPNLKYLNRIPSEYRDYTFFFTTYRDIPGNPLDLSKIEWI